MGASARRGVKFWGILAFFITAVFLSACGSDNEAGSLTVYSGRSDTLVAPLIERFKEETGIDIQVKYAGTPQLAATLLEEGGNSPADAFYAQDPGGLSAVSALLAPLEGDVLTMVPRWAVSANNVWVGVSGRARVIVASTHLSTAEQPQSIFDLTSEQWRGRVGWAPTNGSFQAFVTALRELHGDATTEQWLRDMLANDVQEYPKNTPIVQAVGDGEIDVGLVNHYYLFRFLADDPNYPATNLFTDAADAGALINVAGVGVLQSAPDVDAANRFVAYLLAESSQRYFRDETFEYPLTAGIAPTNGIPALDTLQPPSLRLTSLADLEGTLDLLREVGALP